MTNQEAIKWIDSKLLALSFSADITSEGKRMDLINEEFNVMMLARAALEKQIPMTPEHAILNNNDLWRKEKCTCVRCTETLIIQERFLRPGGGFAKTKHGDRSPYCSSCGQALKWKE